MKNKKAFTLIELLAVIITLFIVLAITVPIVLNVIENTTKSSFKYDAKMILDQIKIETAKDDNFDPTIINLTTLSNYNISNDNYESLTISVIENNPYIYVVGKNKWSGYKVCGTYQDMNIYLATEEGVCEGEVPAPINAEVLIVAGGGGGGAKSGQNCGGGGAGGVIYSQIEIDNVSIYPIVVGDGGVQEKNGEDSSFASITAKGGGHGGCTTAPTSGGSGGGARWSESNKGSGIVGQGFAGGNGIGLPSFGGGGGGGASEPGNTLPNGSGGTGLAFDINGTTTYYGGGGGGGVSGGGTSAAAALGGGGRGGYAPNFAGNGIPNTGGGGGGGADGVTLAGYGGSGIVIIRYLTSETTIDAPTATKIQDGLYTVLSFTTIGNHTITIE